MDFIDVDGKLVFYPNDPVYEKYQLKTVNNLSLEECKSSCKLLDRCVFIQYRKSDKFCGYYTLLPSSNFFQWQSYDRPLICYSLPYNTTQINISKSMGNMKECHEQCKLDANCLYSITSFTSEQSTRKELCNRYNAITNKDYVISYYNEAEEKLNIDKVNTNNTLSYVPPGQNDVENDNPYFVKDEGFGNSMNSSILYGLTIVILILIAIILFICKRRSDNEKMLLYTINNMTANSQSQSRSRSKSSPSENLSYLNNTNLSSSFFQNNFNASSITINPDSFDNSKYIKSSNNRSSSNLKKSARKSTCSKAPSVHSISTLCTNISNNNIANASNNNNNNNNSSSISVSIQGDSTLNDKNSHPPPLMTKKNSTYNYSIKTFSTKDPALTGLSQNIKTLFANSYNDNNNNNNNSNSLFNDSSYSFSNNRASFSTNSLKEFSYEKLYNKESNTSSSSNVKNKYGHHKKHSSSVSISIPKVASSSSINISPKNTMTVTSPQQPKIVKLKKPVHTKQISISRSVYSEPVLPFNTAGSEISIKNDEIDGYTPMDSQDPLTINNNTSTLFKYK